jgi:hypothetical protein
VALITPCLLLHPQNSGTVLSCDAEFTDWMGYRHEDIHGRAVGELSVRPEDLEDLLGRVRQDVAAAAAAPPTYKTSSRGPAAATSSSAGPAPVAEGRQRRRHHQYQDDDGGGEVGVEGEDLLLAAPEPCPESNSQQQVMHVSESSRPASRAVVGAGLGGGKGRGCGVWAAKGVQLKHMYLRSDFKVDISLTVGGIGETAMYVCKVRGCKSTHYLGPVAQAASCSDAGCQGCGCFILAPCLTRPARR